MITLNTAAECLTKEFSKEQQSCLVCCNPISSNSKNDSKTSSKYTKIFQDFIRYMKWKTFPSKAFQFEKELFPFCNVCEKDLTLVSQLHDNVVKILGQIDQIIRNVTTRIFLSDNLSEGSGAANIRVDVDQPEGKPGVDPSLDDGNRDHLQELKKIKYYRSKAKEFYAATVRISVEDRITADNARLISSDIPDTDQSNSLQAKSEVDKSGDGFGIRTYRNPSACRKNPVIHKDFTEITIPAFPFGSGQANSFGNSSATNVVSCTPSNLRRCKKKIIMPNFQKHNIVQLNQYLFLYKDTYKFEIDTEGNNFTCSLCKFTSLSTQILLKHIQEVHIECQQAQAVNTANVQENVMVLSEENKDTNVTAPYLDSDRDVVEPDQEQLETYNAEFGGIVLQTESLPSVQTDNQTLTFFMSDEPDGNVYISSQSEQAEIASAETTYGATVEMRNGSNNNFNDSQLLEPSSQPLDNRQEWLISNLNKIRKVGDGQYIFDNKFLFERDAQYKWTCKTCSHTFGQRHQLEYHLFKGRCKGRRKTKTDKVDNFYKVAEFEFTKCENGRFQCKECSSYFCSSAFTMRRHIKSFHLGHKSNETPKSFSAVPLNTNLYMYRGYQYEILENDVYKCLSCLKTKSTAKEIRHHITRYHISKTRESKPNQVCELDLQSLMDIYKCLACTDIPFISDWRSAVIDHVQLQHPDVAEPAKKVVAICKLCGKTFSSAAQLSKHKVTHTNERPYLCDICGRAYKNKNTMEFHKKQHTGVKRFACPYKNCEKKFWTRTSLLYHTVVHNNSDVPSFPCEFCGKIFAKNRLQKHLQTHTHTLDFECKDCHKKFKYRSTLRKHMMTHSGLKPFMCHICDKAYTASYSLVLHKRAVHGIGNPANKSPKAPTKQTPSSCKICQKTFRSTSYLNAHIRKQHSSERETYECKECNKKFVSKLNLKLHLTYSLAHTGVGRCECNLCGGRYSSPTALYIHKKNYHKNNEIREPPLPGSKATPEKYLAEGVACSICGRVVLKRTLKYHMITHYEGFDYACPDCDKRFKRRESLILHSWNHKGVMPYVCDVCGKGYPKRYELKKHKEKRHIMLDTQIEAVGQLTQIETIIINTSDTQIYYLESS